RRMQIDRHRLDASQTLDLLTISARLLFENGQTTERMIKTLEQLANALGTKATVFPSWGELLLRIDTPTRYEIVAGKPAGIDMNKVAATMDAIEKFCLGRTDAGAFGCALEAVGRLTGVSTPRFALLAGAGAAALGVIFGATHLFSLVLIALSAASGAF